uniref:Protein kish n=1 Tax=Mus spicilegus TaxID=10103 RepID=A0A8C6HY87_MUSSI
MPAITNFQSLLTDILLLIFMCAHIRSLAHSILDRNKTGLLIILWKLVSELEMKQILRCCSLFLCYWNNELYE